MQSKYTARAMARTMSVTLANTRGGTSMIPGEGPAGAFAFRRPVRMEVHLYCLRSEKGIKPHDHN